MTVEHTVGDFAEQLDAPRLRGVSRNAQQVALVEARCIDCFEQVEPCALHLCAHSGFQDAVGPNTDDARHDKPLGVAGMDDRARLLSAGADYIRPVEDLQYHDGAPDYPGIPAAKFESDFGHALFVEFPDGSVAKSGVVTFCIFGNCRSFRQESQRVTLIDRKSVV